MIKALLSITAIMASLSAQAVGDFSFRGNQEAKVTVIVFGDYQCPFTKRGMEQTKLLLVERAEDVKVVFRHYPLSFHEQARPAAIAAVCAGEQGEFWKLHDALFAIENGQMTPETVNLAIKQVGLNNAEMEKCRQSPAAAAVVEQDIKEASLLGILGTPMFLFVGPRDITRLPGAYPLEDMIKAVDHVKQSELN